MRHCMRQHEAALHEGLSIMMALCFRLHGIVIVILKACALRYDAKLLASSVLFCCRG
jgi:hypothetical protein